jgi:hypothetical protein
LFSFANLYFIPSTSLPLLRYHCSLVVAGAPFDADGQSLSSAIPSKRPFKRQVAPASQPPPAANADEDAWSSGDTPQQPESESNGSGGFDDFDSDSPFDTSPFDIPSSASAAASSALSAASSSVPFSISSSSSSNSAPSNPSTQSVSGFVPSRGSALDAMFGKSHPSSAAPMYHHQQQQHQQHPSQMLALSYVAPANQRYAA